MHFCQSKRTELVILPLKRTDWSSISENRREWHDLSLWGRKVDKSWNTCLFGQDCWKVHDAIKRIIKERTAQQRGQMHESGKFVRVNASARQAMQMWKPIGRLSQNGMLSITQGASPLHPQGLSLCGFRKGWWQQDFWYSSYDAAANLSATTIILLHQSEISNHSCVSLPELTHYTHLPE